MEYYLNSVLLNYHRPIEARDIETIDWLKKYMIAQHIPFEIKLYAFDGKESPTAADIDITNKIKAIADILNISYNKDLVVLAKYVHLVSARVECASNET